MALKLNRVENYKEFYGRNVDQMPLLIAEGRTPMSVAGLMDKRLEVMALEDGKDDAFRASWVDNYFDTGDAILYHPNGNIKVVRDAQALREMTLKSKRAQGALVLADRAYDVEEGPEFTVAQLSDMANGRLLTADEVKTHPIWNALARDEDRLEAYTDRTFAEAKKRFNYDENMGIYLGSAQNNLTMRSWFVLRLDVRSSAYGGVNLDNEYGRLVGVAPEALK